MRSGITTDSVQKSANVKTLNSKYIEKKHVKHKIFEKKKLRQPIGQSPYKTLSYYFSKKKVHETKYSYIYLVFQMEN